MTYSHKMLPLPQQYDQAATEKKWQAHWLATKTYAWNPETPRADSYVIDTPPPTVSGTLHMGHVFSYTQADFIARFQRMTGKNVFYPMGFDDNGLPTERLVEKTKKIRATDMSREDFINVCLGVSEEARKEFRALFESIALSVDWAQEYHTISDDSRRLSQLSFLDLVAKDQVYRKLQPMLWDPVDQTAIAQAEVEDKMLPSHFTDIAFTCAETNEELVIGTTRPELLPACVALFYHPDDARYQHLNGKSATVPLFGFSVPILTDETVEPEKGTGLMMCCTFGDEKDIEKWRKHNLPTRIILNKYGKLDFASLPPEAEGPAASSGAYYQQLQGKKVSNPDPKNFGARELTLQLLKEAGLIRQQVAITHAVKCAERSGAALELIPTSQWFVKVTDKKEALKQKSKACNWNPEWMQLRMEQWIDGLNWDWCISRQRYFGVPFPVWYASRTDGTGEVFTIASPKKLPTNPLKDLPKGFELVFDDAARVFNADELAPQEKASMQSNAARVCIATEDIYDINGKLAFKGDSQTHISVIGDPDVMDTWATSSISPQISAGAITANDSRLTTHDSNRFANLYPADLRPQAHEIIRTWAFYTLVKSHLHSDKAPWHNLMISGWCLAEDKSKMSKSKGNVVTPVALIEEKGTDAVRYWAGTSRLGMDTAFSPDLLKIGKKLVGKLWNATQFAAIHLTKLNGQPTNASMDKSITETLDRWILSRLGETVAKATEAFTTYEYADALDATNQFFWADFCDNYLELIKKRVYNEDGSATAAAQQSAVRTLYYVLDGILKLYAPFVPHVTEELYSHIFADAYAAKGSLHAQGQWPLSAHYFIDGQALADGRHALDILEIIRKAKSETNRSIKFPIAKLLIFAQTDAMKATIDRVMGDVAGAGNVLAYELVKEKSAAMTHTPDEHMALNITFAEAADAA